VSSLYPFRENGIGATKAIHNIVKHWNEKGNIVVLDNTLVIVYPIFKIPKIAYCYYPLYRYLNKYFKNNSFKPDIVVAHYDKSLQIGYQYSKRNKLPLVAGLHIAMDIVEKSPVKFNKRCSEILEYSSLIACRSNYIYNKINTWFNNYNNKTFIAYSGIEENIIGTLEDALKRMRQWKARGNVSFISVCTLYEQKKIHTNLTALAELKDKKNWTYTIIGDGKDRNKLELLSKELGINNQVIFKGRLNHKTVIDELRKSHIFIMVGGPETLGLVYLEAMATGNIVIGSKNEGIDGILVDGENGFLSPVGKTEPLTKLLKKIVFNMNIKELENVLLNSHKTISYYTEKKASDNYWKQLKRITGK